MAYNMHYLQPFINPTSNSTNSFRQGSFNIQQFMYSVQCILYKYNNRTSNWEMICQTRNCVIQLYRRDGINIVATSNKSSGQRYFEYPINSLLLSKLHEGKNLYQLQVRERMDEIWGVQFLIKNDGMNFECKFEDLFQYNHQGNTVQEPRVVKNIKEENICLTAEELTSLIKPLQSSIASGSFESASTLLKLICRLPESHRKFTFEPQRNNEYSPCSLEVSVECMDDSEPRLLTIQLDPDMTINALKELFYIKYKIAREQQKWIVGNKFLLGKDSIKGSKDLCLIVMTHDMHLLDAIFPKQNPNQY